MKIKVKNFDQIKIGNLVEYNSRFFLILDRYSDEGFFKVLDIKKLEIKNSKNFFVFKHKLFIIETMDD